MRNVILTLGPILLAIQVTGCEGLTLGENKPSSDTYLEDGSIAVDRATGNAFMLHAVWQQAVKGDLPKVVSKVLYAAHPDKVSASKVLDLTTYSDARVLFPKDSVMVMAERNGLDELILLDPKTFAKKKSKPANARYHGTRSSPSGRFVAVCDNTLNPCPIHFIDSATLDTVVVPHDGYWLEAMWLNKSDDLVAIVFTDPKKGGGARILRWSMDKAEVNKLAPDASGYWPDRKLDIEVDGVSFVLDFSFTWVGISPDDRYAVFPVKKPVPADPKTGKPGGEGGVLDHVYQLLVIDLDTGKLQTIDHAQGPVGFSPDGSTIVSYRHDWVESKQPNGQTVIDHVNARLVLIDRETLEETEADMPFESGPQFFITREGGFILITGLSYAEGFVLYDLDTRKLTKLASPGATLSEFTSRVGHGEIWLISNGVRRIDLDKQEIDALPVGWTPRHINYLPNQDLMVFDDKDVARFVFFDPAAMQVKRAVAIPGK